MKEHRYIIKTDDDRYVKAGTDCASEFTGLIFNAKFFKNIDAARKCVAGSYRWLEKYGKICGSLWPSEFTIVKVEMNEVETIPYK